MTVPAPKPAEKTRIQLVGGRPGDPWTVFQYALSSFINEESEMLRSSVLLTGGVGDYYPIAAEKPENKALSVGTGLHTGTVTLTGKPLGLKTKFLAMQAMQPYVWVTYNKDIKTLADFAGRTVAGPRAVPGWQDHFRIPLELVGVWDKIKFAAAGESAAASSLTDGTVEIAYGSLNYVYPDKISLSSYLEQAKVKAPLYFADWGKDTIEVGLSGKVEWKPILSFEVPPKALGATQPERIYVWLLPLFWAADLAMDEKVAYEITRIIYTRAKKGDFAGFHAQGAGIVPGMVEYGPWKTKQEIEEWYHPGALKFYREIGIKGL